MEPFIARGFITLLLSPTRIAQVKEIEEQLPSGRYLQGFEICQFYSLHPEPVEESREAKMKALFYEWEKSDAYGFGTIGEWMDYVSKNWIEPLPFGKRRASDKFAEMASILIGLLILK